MMLLIVGPSGVGKSTLGLGAKNGIALYEFQDLDNLVKSRTGKSAGKLLPEIKNDAFLELCRHEVIVLETKYSSKLCAVAVGAGALQSDHALEWLSGYQTLAITAPAGEVFARGGERNKNRTLAQFEETEYSSRRLEIYDSAAHKVAVDGLSIQQAQQKFDLAIESIIASGKKA